ncbi:MAG TPA: phytanoyl-CoA dioxygenase family protein [Caldilineaceae bacterium]|nr:phytanoyl-CoA dioxygenase family protein [Caldilineaceae bacterium]
MVVTPQQVDQYQQQGFCVLKSVIPAEHLANLRAECARFIEVMHAEMDAKGTDTLGISHRNSRYFISRRAKESEKLMGFLFSNLMCEVTQALLGPDVYLFNEQYVVKAAEKGMKFSWHQDSGYVDFNGGAPHKPYLSCWCPLDDATIANGTVYILPFDRAGTREIVRHVEEAGSNDKVGYFGNDPGDPVEVPAGSIVCFTSYTFHRSGPNTTNQMRRVYLAQYSPEPLRKLADGSLWGWAIPVVENGQKVAA